VFFVNFQECPAILDVFAEKKTFYFAGSDVMPFNIISRCASKKLFPEACRDNNLIRV
jgi:hypothetical protein